MPSYIVGSQTGDYALARGKLLKTKDAVRLALDGLGTVGSIGTNWDKGFCIPAELTDNRVATVC